MGVTFEDLTGKDWICALNETAAEVSKSGIVHPVEVQQFQIALEVVLEKLTEAQVKALTDEMIKGGHEEKLTQGVRLLIVNAAMRLGDRQRKQSVPKN